MWACLRWNSIDSVVHRRSIGQSKSGRGFGPSAKRAIAWGILPWRWRTLMNFISFDCDVIDAIGGVSVVALPVYGWQGGRWGRASHLASPTLDWVLKGVAEGFIVSATEYARTFHRVLAFYFRILHVFWWVAMGSVDRAQQYPPLIGRNLKQEYSCTVKSSASCPLGLTELFYAVL